MEDFFWTVDRVMRRIGIRGRGVLSGCVVLVDGLLCSLGSSLGGVGVVCRCLIRAISRSRAFCFPRQVFGGGVAGP